MVLYSAHSAQCRDYYKVAHIDPCSGIARPMKFPGHVLGMRCLEKNFTPKLIIHEGHGLNQLHISKMMNSKVHITCRYAPKIKCIVMHKEVEPDKWISCNNDFF